MSQSYEDFRVFNEEMSRQAGPDKYHKTQNPLIRFAENLKIKKINSILTDKHESVLLDVGCGSGDITAKIDCKKRIGVDLSTYSLRYAKENNSSVDLMQADAQILPLRNDSFSNIIIADVIEHVPKPDDVIKEIFRVVKKQGRVILNVPNDNYIDKWKGFLNRLALKNFFVPEYYQDKEDAKNKWHLHVFTLDEIKLRLAKYFVINTVEYIPFKLMPFQFLLVLHPKK